MDIYQKILNGLLWLRLPQKAFAVSERWAKSENLSKVEAALDLQVHLVEHYGYHECPHCLWATAELDEHIHNLTHPCAVGNLTSLLIGAIREGFANVLSGMETQPEQPSVRPTFH